MSTADTGEHFSAAEGSLSACLIRGLSSPSGAVPGTSRYSDTWPWGKWWGWAQACGGGTGAGAGPGDRSHWRTSSQGQVGACCGVAGRTQGPFRAIGGGQAVSGMDTTARARRVSRARCLASSALHCSGLEAHLLLEQLFAFLLRGLHLGTVLTLCPVLHLLSDEVLIAPPLLVGQVLLLAGLCPGLLLLCFPHQLLEQEGPVLHAPLVYPEHAEDSSTGWQ